MFSCSLMHEALPVTRGRAMPCCRSSTTKSGAKLRETNLEYLADDRLRDDVKRSIPSAAGSSRDRQTS